MLTTETNQIDPKWKRFKNDADRYVRNNPWQIAGLDRKSTRLNSSH